MLVVEDDAAVRVVVASYLTAAGFVVDGTSHGLSALRLIERAVPDLVVLDRILPDIDGVEVYRRIHSRVRVPVVMLTALGSTTDRIEGFEAGVDDYVTKPFSAQELVLRVQNVLRRSIRGLASEKPFAVGPFEVEPTTRQIRKDGVLLALSAREHDLLAFLLRHPKQVFTRQQLRSAVWHSEYGDLSTVTVHVRRLREKIEQTQAHPRFITTIWGIGYRLDP